MGWFTNWFGTPYYQLLYQHRDEQEAQLFLDQLINYLPVYQGMRVLDIGCGQGRHSLYLSEKGFEVIGLDVVKENIEEAARFETEHLTFVQHDMRDPFPVDEADLALNLFTSFGYFENEGEDLQVLENICESLKPRGVFVIDFLNAYKVERELVPSETVQRDSVRFDIKRYIDNGRVIKEICAYDDGDEYCYMEQVQLLRLSDFEQYFDTVGFIIHDVFGNYQLAPYDKEESDRLILIAEKKA